MNKEIAELFHDQCVGEHNGHMAPMPNNPLFKSIFAACGLRGDSKKGFAKVLREMADALEKSEENVPF
jgi:hypothetical protein